MDMRRILGVAALLPGMILGAALAHADNASVVYGIYSDAEDLDPHTARGGIADHIVTIALFDPLIWDFDAAQSPDQRRGLRPMLAESWEVIDDHRWRLVLRQGVTFHNGAPLNAEAVKFSLERPHQPDFETGDKISTWRSAMSRSSTTTRSTWSPRSRCRSCPSG